MTVRFVVSGRVQGVGFRWFVLRSARSLGLTGYVSNLPDGHVEVVAAGTEGQIAELEALLRKGPPAARVTGVEKIEIVDEVNGFMSFDIS
jgi:acylphosphatase